MEGSRGGGTERRKDEERARREKREEEERMEGQGQGERGGREIAREDGEDRWEKALLAIIKRQML